MTIGGGIFLLLLMSLPALSEVESLRGEHPLDAGAKMFDKKRIVVQRGGFQRAWKLQPPQIPHTVDKDRINLQENTCMRCHSRQNYQKEKAPVVGASHFKDEAGNMQAEVNGRRYFCNQCHVPQLNAEPLVDNTF